MSLLKGLRVVEMGLWIAGPAAGGMLADWGAEVVKIEMLSGDPMRNLYGAMSGSKESRCPPFDNYNRGKRSIAIDVNLPEGAALARRLALTADVFLTNMRPQFLDRVGLGHETLLAADGRLVYGVLSGYGLEGPDKDLPGYDLAAFSARGSFVVWSIVSSSALRCALRPPTVRRRGRGSPRSYCAPFEVCSTGRTRRLRSRRTS